MTTGKYELVIKWASGQSTICGEMTDHQHGEICRILSPDYRAQLPSQGGEAVEVVATVEAYGGKWAGIHWGECIGSTEDPERQLMTVAQHQRIMAAQRIKTCIALKERNDAREALTAPPLIDPALTNSQCACGDEYAANSYGAGFMAANNGVCENCDTYTAPPSPDAELVELLRSKFPRIDPCKPVPLDEKAHCCEYTIYVERERERLQGLVEAIQSAVNSVCAPAAMTPSKAEYYKAGVREVITSINEVLAKFRGEA